MRKIVCVVGANASGKSSLGVDIALRCCGDVISADSRQIYRGLNLGSGKISVEEMRGIAHHMIDVANPGEVYSLYQYQSDALSKIDETLDRGSLPIVVGGAGLYVDAIVEGFKLVEVPPNIALRSRLELCSTEEIIEFINSIDLSAIEALDANNRRRLIRAAEILTAGVPLSSARQKEPVYGAFKIGIYWDRDVLRKRILDRLNSRLAEGMVEEVVTLRESGVSDAFLFDIGLEYRFILRFLQGQFLDYDEFRDQLFFAICQYAKRQYTWFRKDKRISWADGANLQLEGILGRFDSFLEKSESLSQHAFSH
jgi:tRNA dimethylallyltransferase